tara:strand:- start:221 stop:373 length:153 start_codon:yes stop_codon:yes gene_type:complete
VKEASFCAKNLTSVLHTQILIKSIIKKKIKSVELNKSIFCNLLILKEKIE